MSTAIYPPLFDSVLETTTTTGTGTLTLAGAVLGYQAFSIVGDGKQAAYSVWAVDGNGARSGAWETGYGTYTLSGTTLSRDQVVGSSNSNALVNFGAGTKRVAVAAHSQSQLASPTGAIWTPPASLSWSWVNQGSATIATNGNGFLYLAAPAQNSLNARCRTKTLSFANTYTLTACIYYMGSMTQATDNFGIYLRDSGTGKLVLFAIQYSGTAAQTLAIGAFAFNAPNSFSATYFQNNFYPSNPLYLRFVDDNVNRNFMASSDGINYTQWFSHARTTFITPDTAGFYVDPENTTYPVGMNLVSWTETTP